MTKKKKSSSQGLIIFTSQNSQAHRIIDNWNEHRVLGSEELHSIDVEKKDVKASVKPRAEGSAGVGSVDLSAASILGYR